MFYDLTGLEEVMIYTDLFVTVIFLIDLYFLYKKADTIKDFVFKNWLDIIAVIPFGFAFRLAKLVRVLRIMKIFSRSSKIVKISKVSKINKVSKTLRIKAEIPRVGKLLSKFKKEK